MFPSIRHTAERQHGFWRTLDSVRTLNTAAGAERLGSEAGTGRPRLPPPLPQSSPNHRNSQRCVEAIALGIEHAAPPTGVCRSADSGENLSVGFRGVAALPGGDGMPSPAQRVYRGPWS